ncbi:nucleoporin-domain-containing protein [Dissoconium aciculare CBS 342.82]|uniref:Nucleoporin-domain-containing protein n=1 Tax=Dissoconium aciculare CBS 342.82 TaxID=1314786 RepID=A0A6J3LXZ1_9PEZI|nr:nucleoporin-domain-containing protein [Dissoconium aciculare CBS 342.82]KAF1819507.1 nucleoporin-domain-containing protein [Dissoconium aciculare CBS 342.82]
MASALVPATPQRPLPGAFFATPAQPVAQPSIHGNTIFAQDAAKLRVAATNTPTEPAGTARKSEPSPVERAARVINEALVAEERFPELETYINQGVSGDYDIPQGPARAPFQKLRTHDIPLKLLEQANYTGMAMQMGIFPPLSHAWIALDNALYLWDYTQSNPEIIGYEEATQPITAVELVPPKPGVFIADIKHMIIICTASDMLLLGVATQTTSTGAQTVALYNTKMSIPIRGIDVRVITASKKTGRIFFTGAVTDDIFEFQYQQEEGWFRGKCNRLCHTKTTLDLVSENVKTVGHFFGSKGKCKIIRQMLVDDSRNLMYTLSTTSEIKVWLIKDNIEHAMMRPLASLLQNAGHFDSRTELLTAKDVEIVSINAISVVQARKLGLMATTNTGCRLYLSLTRGYGSQADAQNPPSSMQIMHIRFPPRDPHLPSASQPGQSAMMPYNTHANQNSQIDSTSRYLTPTNMGYRYSPGYWMAFQTHPQDGTRDRVFCTAPDSARLKCPQDSNQIRYSESGQWIDLPANLQQIMPLGDEFGATNEPLGFGNELAVQFDRASSEFAIVTTAGIQILRRRRLVDIFAALMKYGSSDDKGTEGEVNRFVRTYGRGETAATALAVACGQGLDVSESRVANVTDSEVIEKARRVFIEQGGKPEYSANAVVDQTAEPIDNVRPSPRHEGMALYISRLVRPLWRANVMKENAAPGAPVKLGPNVSLGRLRLVQRDLTALNEFLSKNTSFIEGLSGPQALSRVSSRQEEIALQGEARAMTSLLRLIDSINEGISFVITLFEERVEEIVALLSDENKRKAKELTFERLFVSSSGRELAKDLTKAIVNRSIANGSNVDSVAERLRRKCGSFCSADDVTIFKAQELVKRASEAGAQSESARINLNESQRLFQKVASNLGDEYIEWTVDQYVSMEFFAGACQLCLVVAGERDKSNRAMAWMRDGRPGSDSRQAFFDQRFRCYEFVFDTIKFLDDTVARAPDVATTHPVQAKRINEAYEVINSSEDRIFLTCLYDEYIRQGNPLRLLDIENPFVVEYLRQRSNDNRAHADLLWRYYAHNDLFLDAAAVQLDVARSHFELPLEQRIEYLSRARAHASTRQNMLLDPRKNKQKLMREVSDLLEIASVQDEILERIKGETRIAPDRKPTLIADLNGPILSVGTLFSSYADAAGYHDFCIILYQVADHRNPADIQASWRSLIDQTDSGAPEQVQPWEAVGDEVRRMGRRLHTANASFPIQFLLPLLERYAIDPKRQSTPPESWAVDLFLDLEIPHETLLPVLEQMYYSNEQPFIGNKRKIIAAKMVHLIQKWFEVSERSGERVLFGGEENFSTVQDCLQTLLRQGQLTDAWKRTAEALEARVLRAVR